MPVPVPNTHSGENFPYENNASLVNVAMSFDEEAMLKFKKGLAKGVIEDTPNVFSLTPGNQLISFESKIGKYQSETEAGLLYDLKLLELPTEEGDYFQAMLFEQYIMTKNCTMSMVADDTGKYSLTGGIEGIPSLYLMWGYGAHERTWSEPHKAIISEIKYDFNTFGDKILNIKMQDIISFEMGVLANKKASYEILTEIDFNKSFYWNISNSISKFLSGVFYNSFTVVNLGKEFKAKLDAREKKLTTHELSDAMQKDKQEGEDFVPILFSTPNDPAPLPPSPTANQEKLLNQERDNVERLTFDLNTLKEKESSLTANKSKLINESTSQDPKDAEIAQIEQQLTNNKTEQKSTSASITSSQNNIKNLESNVERRYPPTETDTTYAQGGFLDGADPEDAFPASKTGDIEVSPKRHSSGQSVDTMETQRHSENIDKYNSLLQDFLSTVGFSTYRAVQLKNNQSPAQPKVFVYDDSIPETEGDNSGSSPNRKVNDNFATELEPDLQKEFDTTMNSMGSVTTSPFVLHLNVLRSEQLFGRGSWDKDGKLKPPPNLDLNLHSSDNGFSPYSVIAYGKEIGQALSICSNDETDKNGPAHMEQARFIVNAQKLEEKRKNYEEAITTADFITNKTTGMTSQERQDFLEEVSEAQYQQDRDDFSEKSKIKIYIRMAKPAGISMRDFILGSKNSNNNVPGLVPQLTELADALGVEDHESLIFTSSRIKDDIIVNEYIKNSEMATLVYLGKENLYHDLILRGDCRSGDKYHEGTSFRKVHSLKCTSNSVRSSSDSKVSDTPESYDLVFTYGRRGVATTEGTQYIQQEPLIIDMKYKLFSSYYYSLFSNLRSNNESISDRHDTSITAMLEKLTAEGKDKFMENYPKWLGVSPSDSNYHVIKKRASKVWDYFTDSASNTFSISKFSTDDNLRKIATSDMQDIKSNIVNGAKGLSDEDAELGLNFFFSLTKSKKPNKRWVGEEETFDNTSVDESVLVPTYLVEGWSDPDPKIQTIDLLNQQANHYSRINQLLHELTITVPGIPELSSLNEVWGKDRRWVKIQVYNQRTGTAHWLSGKYSLYGMSHKISSDGGYVTKLHLINMVGKI